MLYTIGGTKVESHLAYADDPTLFCKALNESFFNMREILKDFYDFSRLQISQEKSYIGLSVSVTNGDELAKVSGLHLKHLSI